MSSSSSPPFLAWKCGRVLSAERTLRGKGSHRAQLAVPRVSGVAGGAGAICGQAANSIRHSGETEGRMDGLDAPAPAPTRCPLKGSATNGQCVCPPLISSDAGTLMLCVKDSCPPARLSSDPGLGARPADPGVGHSGAAGWLQSLPPIQVSGQQRHFPGMLVSREAPRKLLEMHHVLLAGPGDMAPARMCSHGAAASETRALRVRWCAGFHRQTRPGLLQGHSSEWGDFTGRAKEPQTADLCAGFLRHQQPLRLPQELESQRPKGKKGPEAALPPQGGD